jgi:hypothetical protein
MHFIFPIISLFSIFVCIHSQPSVMYQRLASLYCFIDDYPAWLEQQSMLNYVIQLSEFYYIDPDRIEQALEQYRLQRECLRVLERLPIMGGGG